jgi:hypothetical protein
VDEGPDDGDDLVGDVVALLPLRQPAPGGRGIAQERQHGGRAGLHRRRRGDGRLRPAQRFDAIPALQQRPADGRVQLLRRDVVGALRRAEALDQPRGGGLVPGHAAVPDGQALIHLREGVGRDDLQHRLPELGLARLRARGRASSA